MICLNVKFLEVLKNVVIIIFGRFDKQINIIFHVECQRKFIGGFLQLVFGNIYKYKVQT